MRANPKLPHHYIQFAHGKLNFELMKYCPICKRYFPKEKYKKHMEKHLKSIIKDALKK